MAGGDNAPVIVGVGRFTVRPADAPLRVADTVPPLGFMARAARQAAADTRVADPEALLRELEVVCTVDTFTDQQIRIDNQLPGAFSKMQLPPNPNLPRSLARKLGARPATNGLWHSFTGGNSPQYCVGVAADRLARGEIRGPVLIAGAEALASYERAKKEGWHLKAPGKGGDPAKRLDHWCDLCEAGPDGGGEEEHVLLNTDASMFSLRELSYGMGNAPMQFSAFETANRHRVKLSVAEYTERMAALWEKFSSVAAERPQHSWFPQRRERKQFGTVGPSNRMVAGTYTKLLCPILAVDQGAALILMTRADAARRGIPDDRVVYLHATADCYARGNGLADRPAYGDVPELQALYEELRRAGDVGDYASDMSFFDLYSCFPVAVFQACRYLGLDWCSEPGARLTRTGGLPFHGGPGNNYVSHSIAAMVETLRARPGERGLVSALGGPLQKHSAGIYSTAPPRRPYQRRAPSEYAPLTKPLKLTDGAPPGVAEVDTYAVKWSARGEAAEQVVIYGRMVSGPQQGRRFIAYTKPQYVPYFVKADAAIGTRGALSKEGRVVLFIPEGGEAAKL
eukprot:TRINITY_DN70542_c0_g1_i1.p1 TRINITY_DN70542_c0_g1~~TRINITY_DN70542_c0_g1_i1.p1  ORF type:complete len:594 (+),score=154.51 TRINITY_DN70542_c0_g1_i1:80-1783(+)